MPPAGGALEEVLVLDFGGQYSQLIARRIRECGVFAELLPATTSVEKIRERKPKGLVLSGGPASVYEPEAPKFPTQLLDLGDSDAGDLLRDAGDGAGAGRPGRVGGVGGVRAYGSGPSRWRRQAARRSARGAELLDESPRCRLRGAGGVHRAGLQPQLAGCRLRVPRSRPLRDPVPPRGRPHALRDRDPHPLPARRRRLQGAVVAAVGDRRAGGEDPGSGGGGEGDLRPLRRGRFLGCRPARPQGGRRQADLRLRRPRADADERGRAGGRGLRASSGSRSSTSTPKSASSPSSPARTTRRRSGRSSAPSSSASSRRRRTSSRTSATWSRARSTRT